MSTEQVAPFHGNKEDENPEDFLRAFFRRMGSATDAVKIQQFPNYLQADSVVDEWYDGLTVKDKADWPSLEAAFRARWPRKKAARKTPEEYEESIMKLKLKMDDVGKKEKVGGREIYTHIAWANKMEVLVKGAQLENTKTYIGQVRKDLPKLLREKIGIGHANWTAFLQAIRDVDTEYIREGIDTWKKEQAEQDAVKAQLQSIQQLLKVSSVTQLQQQLASLNLGNLTQTNPPVQQPNLSQIPPSTSGPPVSQATKRPPPTPADRTAIRAQLQKYPQHPDTDAGWLAHAAQQARPSEWRLA